MIGFGAAQRGLFDGFIRSAAIPACFVLASALAVDAGRPALAEPQVRAKFGDWDLRCEHPAGASQEQCALVQTVSAEDVPGLTVIVLILKLNQGQSRVMRVIAPLGVLLPMGLGLIIDEAKIGNTGFQRCNPQGCVAEALMDDKLVDQLKTGKTATFVVHEKPNEGIGLPVQLSGFKEGFAKLP